MCITSIYSVRSMLDGNNSALTRQDRIPDPHTEACCPPGCLGCLVWPVHAIPTAKLILAGRVASPKSRDSACIHHPFSPPLSPDTFPFPPDPRCYRQ